MFNKLFISFFLLSISLNAFAGDKPQVRFTTNKGDIVLELDRVKAPISVNNFLQYAKSGYYVGTVFHRVIKGFMIQGGGFSADLQRRQTQQGIQNEATNGLKNDRGTIAMARTNMPHSATAQFFINTANNTNLNHTSKSMRGWGYAVFGKVTQGMKVVDAIENSKTGAKGIFSQDVPMEDIIIQKVIIISE